MGAETPTDDGACCLIAPHELTARRYELGGVNLTGILSLHGAVLYWRRNSKAITYSAVDWNPETVWPFVLELEATVLNRDEDKPYREGADYFRVTFSLPCPCDPRTPAALPAIRALVHRFLTHEADEALVLPDGTRPFDPHEGVEAPAVLNLVNGALCL